MKKELRDKWLKNLRSGEFKQCFDGHLYDYSTGSHCTIGLLCEASPEFTRITDPSRNRSSCFDVDFERDGKEISGSVGGQPDPYTDRLFQIDNEHDLTDVENFLGTVAEMNDEKKMSFEELSDFVEKEVQCL
jgi:hypothetical protein